MLVTFHSKAWSSITLFGDVATRLLQMAGHSGTVPGALLAKDIPAATERLRQALAACGPDDEARSGTLPHTDDPDAPPPVGLRLRAHPLLELLSAAARQGEDVMWDAGAPLL
jgi:Domain of unknown function (DUF1840)